MDRNMRNNHPMMTNMSKRHPSSHHHQHQPHHQPHAHGGQSVHQSMMGQNRDRDLQQQQTHHHLPVVSSSSTGSQQNDDLIKYIEDSWHKVTSVHGPNSGAKYYSSANEPGPPANFEPFDVEGYWGRRMVQNLSTTNFHQ